MIYATDERIDSVNVGSKDMVVLMQDNHILALGTKYWAVNMGKLIYASNLGTWPTSSVYTAGISNIVLSGGKVMLKSDKVTGYYLTGTTLIVTLKDSYANSDAIASALNNVWLIFEFNQTLYAKVDLGSLSWYTSTNYRYHSDSLAELAKKTSDNLTKGNIYCLSLITLSANDLSLHTEENAISIDSNGYLKIFRSVEYFEDKTLQEFINSIKGKELLYEVAE